MLSSNEKQIFQLSKVLHTITTCEYRLECLQEIIWQVVYALRFLFLQCLGIPTTVWKSTDVVSNGSRGFTVSSRDL